ncbi:prostaglandin E2 receptor EP3 subtype isoform X2 [Belonocnema kinseyi]|uniref:prostaglandin E2 receptor EP3 subtype isoform X2 n=1 Tax=Belonocnema kinseyi TaxID=2817044 RepID=UPI00143D291F|nr:prostaglandin E2 receptor EP3 subtype isoform X2 [Belonocnema kinseyi]
MEFTTPYHVGNMTSIVEAKGVPHVSFGSQIVLTLVYLTGVVGNLSALFILFHKDKRRNPKHLLMLRCLAINDLVALLGMLVQMYVTIYVAGSKSSRAICSLRVIWRLFGLFSGCVAIVMAAERWLALTRPFVYQKRVTFPMIVRFMLVLWLGALALTTLPLFGFGLYFKDGKCCRYREATEAGDIAYAYIWFFFVSRALSRLGRRAANIRRISRAKSKAKPLLTVAGPPQDVVATAEERAFARLMAILSISFVVCWMPQMVSIPLAQYGLKVAKSATILHKILRAFHIIADILMCIHFTLDPYIYVILHLRRPHFSLLKPFCRICRPHRSRSSSFTGTTDQHCSSADSPTPITDVPTTPVSEEHEPQFVSVAV